MTPLRRQSWEGIDGDGESEDLPIARAVPNAAEDVATRNEERQRWANAR